MKWRVVVDARTQTVARSHPYVIRWIESTYYLYCRGQYVACGKRLLKVMEGAKLHARHAEELAHPWRHKT